MTRRVDNWPILLADYVEMRREVPFEWGVQDCCSFAAEWVRLATGVDVFAPWRGRYASMLGGMRYIIGAGGVGKIPGSVGLNECPTARITRGDLGGVSTTKGLALGICIGGRIAAPGNTGLEFLKRSRLKLAWRV